MQMIIISILAVLLGFLGCKPLNNNNDHQDDNNDALLRLKEDNLGNFFVNVSDHKRLTLSNDGKQDLTDINVVLPKVLTFKGGAYPGANGTCRNVLPAQSSCELDVVVNPWPQKGVMDARIKVSYQVNDITKNIILSSKLTFKDIEKIAAQPVSFGSVDVGKSLTQPLYLTNMANDQDISDVSITLPGGLPFRAVNANACQNIAPRQKCDFLVEFTPLSAMNIADDATISYKIAGQNLTEQVRLEGIGNGVNYIDVNGYNIDQTAEFNQKALVTLTLKHHDPADTTPITNIKIDKLLLTSGAKLTKTKTSSCKKATILLGASTCTIVLETSNPIITDSIITDNIKIFYDYNGVSFTYPLSVVVNFSIHKVEVDHYQSNHNFNKAYLKNGQTKTITIIVTNPSYTSLKNLSLPHNFTIHGLITGMKPDLALASTTCMGNLNPGSSCKFTLTTDPVMADLKNYSKDLEIKYQASGQNIVLPLKITGDFILPVVGALGYGANDMLYIDNTNPKPFYVKDDQLFTLPLLIKNTKNHQVVAMDVVILDSKLKTNPKGRKVKDIEVLPSSSCFTDVLKLNETCHVYVSLKANALNIVKNIKRTLRITYKDEAHNDHHQDFPIDVSWVSKPILPYYRKVVTAPASPWPENLTKPEVINIISTDPRYKYIFRPKITGGSAKNYPQLLWDKLPDFSYHGLSKTPFEPNIKTDKWMPWMFNPSGFSLIHNDEKAVFALADVIPDRFKDPITGHEYVVLYHGTNNTLNVFSPGATAIGVDKAKATAFGDGFYLAAAAPDSLEYGCNYASNTILLTVGVQVDPHIYVIRDRSARNTYGITKGDPELNPGNTKYNPNVGPGDNRYPDVFCQGTGTGTSQFVCYRNVLPYLRILKIEVFARGHGKTKFLNDYDGVPEGAYVDPLSVCN